MSRHLRIVPEPDTASQAFPYPTPIQMPHQQDIVPTLTAVPEHRVRVYLVYLDWSETGKGRRTDIRTEWPWKWQADCTCGWHCLSWSWSRAYDMERSNLSPEHWIAENGNPVGGTLVWALEHLAEKHAESTPQRAQEG